MIRKGFGPRLGATLIDAVFLIVVGLILGIIFGLGASVRFGTPTSSGGQPVVMTGAMIIVGIISALFGLAYYSTEIFMAASPGHRILGMKIMRADGTPADQATLIKRYLIRHSPDIASLIAVIPGLGMFGYVRGALGLLILVSCFMTLRESKQALHDEWSDTAVYGPGTVPVGFPVGPANTVGAPNQTPPAV